MKRGSVYRYVWQLIFCWTQALNYLWIEYSSWSFSIAWPYLKPESVFIPNERDFEAIPLSSPLWDFARCKGNLQYVGWFLDFIYDKTSTNTSPKKKSCISAAKPVSPLGRWQHQANSLGQRPRTQKTTSCFYNAQLPAAPARQGKQTNGHAPNSDVVILVKQN